MYLNAFFIHPFALLFVMNIVLNVLYMHVNVYEFLINLTSPLKCLDRFCVNFFGHIESIIKMRDLIMHVCRNEIIDIHLFPYSCN